MPPAMKRPARGATESKQVIKTHTLLHDGANEPTNIETRGAGVLGAARSAIKRPAAMNACRVPDPKHPKTDESRAVESDQAVRQDETDECRDVESHEIGVPCNATIHDLFLAAQASRSPCGRADRTAKDAELCEQVHNLGWFPRESYSTRKKQRDFNKNRKDEHRLADRIKKQLTRMSTACQAYLSTMKAVKPASHPTSLAVSRKGPTKADTLKLYSSEVAEAPVHMDAPRKETRNQGQGRARKKARTTAAFADIDGEANDHATTSRNVSTESAEQSANDALFMSAMEHADANQKEILRGVKELGHFPRRLQGQQCTPEARLNRRICHWRQTRQRMPLASRVYLDAMERVCVPDNTHPQVEETIHRLKHKYWNKWEETCWGDNYLRGYLEGDLPKEPLELLRDLCTVRSSVNTHTGRTKLNTLGRRLGYRADWKVGKSRHLHWSPSKLQHLCRAHLCDLADAHMEKHTPRAAEPCSAQADTAPQMFQTPSTLKDFAASLRHEDHRHLTPIASDFLTTTYKGRVSRRQLLRHLLVLEKYADCIEETPLMSNDCISLFAAGSAREADQGLAEVLLVSEDDVIQELHAVSEDADENEDRWVSRVMCKVGKKTHWEVIDIVDKVKNFFQFLLEHNLQQVMQLLRPRRILTLCIWHAYLQATCSKRLVPPSVRTVELWTKPQYIPAEDINASDIPYFRKMANEDGPPLISAPRECQLCGEGFVDFTHLVKHCESKHGNWNEYRKRVFFEADELDALSLPRRRKRQQLSNFTYHLTHSLPGDGGAAQPRRTEACAVCARKGWLESRYRAYLFKPSTDHCESMETDEEQCQDGAEDEDGEGRAPAKKEGRQRRLLRDRTGKSQPVGLKRIKLRSGGLPTGEAACMMSVYTVSWFVIVIRISAIILCTRVCNCLCDDR